MSVTPGQVHKEVPWEKNRQEKQEYRLREKMIKKKHKNLYKSMMQGRKERAKEIWLLRKKRRLHDEKELTEKKLKKKQQKIEPQTSRKTIVKQAQQNKNKLTQENISKKQKFKKRKEN